MTVKKKFDSFYQLIFFLSLIKMGEARKDVFFVSRRPLASLAREGALAKTIFLLYIRRIKHYVYSFINEYKKGLHISTK